MKAYAVVENVKKYNVTLCFDNAHDVSVFQAMLQALSTEQVRKMYPEYSVDEIEHVKVGIINAIRNAD